MEVIWQIVSFSFTIDHVVDDKMTRGVNGHFEPSLVIDAYEGQIRNIPWTVLLTVITLA